MDKKIRWGILSTAKIGTIKVMPAIQNSQLNVVSAIASRNLKNAEKVAERLNIRKYYGSYEELLSDPDIDAIYNPLPNNLHVEWTIKAMEAGKHVLCEKPIGIDAAEAEKLADAASRYPKLKVMEAFMYRFHPQWEKVLSLVNEGAIGTAKSVHTHFSYYNVDPKNIRNRPEVHGGALMDIGCYCISFPRFIYQDEPVSVVGVMEHDPDMGTDRQTSGILKFENGKTASFTCSTQLMPYQRANIVGTEGQIIVEIPVNAPPTEISKIELITKTNNETIQFGPVDQYSLQADAFSKSILEDLPVPTPLKDAIGNMKVIDAIVASAKSNKWTDIKE